MLLIVLSLVSLSACFPTFQIKSSLSSTFIPPLSTHNRPTTRPISILNKSKKKPKTVSASFDSKSNNKPISYLFRLYDPKESVAMKNLESRIRMLTGINHFEAVITPDFFEDRLSKISFPFENKQDILNIIHSYQHQDYMAAYKYLMYQYKKIIDHYSDDYLIYIYQQLKKNRDISLEELEKFLINPKTVDPMKEWLTRAGKISRLLSMKEYVESYMKNDMKLVCDFMAANLCDIYHKALEDPILHEAE